MCRKQRDCSFRQRRTLKTGSAVVLVLTILGAVAAGVILTREKPFKAQKIIRTAQESQNLGCEVMELNPLREEAYPEISSRVRDYYHTEADKTEFTDSYENIVVYTKRGRYPDTYVVFARYEMKIKDIYTPVPGLGTFYAELEEDGGKYRIRTETPDEATEEYIHTLISQEDIQKLMTEIETEYAEALQSDALLREALADLKNAYEESDDSQ